uniref:Uncharacterized protein n=1 Tax=Coccidioides posadasii RMSCC 3488 TaxID=454284 RepID=A0A0J6F2H0_COCPO|nr:hypothetical protein CPAG_03422 [Coccidioides posadasii RMSCC 3488]
MFVEDFEFCLYLARDSFWCRSMPRRYLVFLRIIYNPKVGLMTKSTQLSHPWNRNFRLWPIFIFPTLPSEPLPAHLPHPTVQDGPLSLPVHWQGISSRTPIPLARRL